MGNVQRQFYALMSKVTGDFQKSQAKVRMRRQPQEISKKREENKRNTKTYMHMPEVWEKDMLMYFVLKPINQGRKFTANSQTTSIKKKTVYVSKQKHFLPNCTLCNIATTRQPAYGFFLAIIILLPHLPYCYSCLLISAVHHPCLHNCIY